MSVELNVGLGISSVLTVIITMVALSVFVESSGSAFQAIFGSSSSRTVLTDVAIIDAGAMAASRCNEAEHPCGSFRPLRRSQRSRLPDVVIAVWIQKFFGYTASILRRKRPFVCLLAHIQALAAERQHSRGDALAERNGLRVERDSVRGQTDALSQARSSLTDLSSQLEARQREHSNLTTTINHGLQDTVDAGEYRRSIAGTHHAEVRPIFVTNQELIKV